MKDSSPRTIHLSDYQVPDYLLPETKLSFEIFENKTRVSSKLKFTKNHEGNLRPLVLSGEKMELISVSYNGENLSSNDYTLNSKGLSLQPSDDEFTLEVVNEIDPSTNKALEGLYKSGDIYCTQNEPEGFRKITYYLDRSDVMSVFTTRIEADKKQFPVLLSNGNSVEKGELTDGRHFAVWNDPFKKPCYLFALVAGGLACVSDTFTTCTGRVIDLEIYVDHGNEDRCPHALESLKKSMKWDEEVFGLEYDLDLFMIVAVDAFNMGAMENKGLNIFNSTCALANPKTATDANFLRIESIIAHEYFHNWTGNRVTCRDWFQLTLKEGLTVFRDQEFSADMNSRAVFRIEDVMALRNSQFVEDAGPNAHPIKPSSYMEINNFYTPTVYEKGAEVIRMIHTLIGASAFRKGMDKYFELYDGQAVTTEDFVQSMELASGRDLSQFKNWYSQFGTPAVKVESTYDAKKQEYTLSFKQELKSGDQAYLIPVKIGLLNSAGKDLELNSLSDAFNGEVFELNELNQSVTFTNITSEPIPSLFRDFSAPVKVEYDYSKQDLAFLFANDSDAFNRYEAGQRLAIIEIEALAEAIKNQEELLVDPKVLEAFGTMLSCPESDDAFKALAISLPSLVSLSERQDILDVHSLESARKQLKGSLADHYKVLFKETYIKLIDDGEYKIDQFSIGARRLKNTCLSYLMLSDDPEALVLAKELYGNAGNLTDKTAALLSLLQVDDANEVSECTDFYDLWKHDAIVINKWFVMQASSSFIDAQKTLELESMEAFDMKNPNKVRSLYAVFAGNLTKFHALDGSGYELIADKIIELNAFNPQIAAGLSKAFKKYAYLNETSRSLMKVQLERILATPDLSGDVYEIISKTLA